MIGCHNYKKRSIHRILFFRFLLVLGLVFSTQSVQSAPTLVQNVRISSSTQSTRLILETNKQINFRIEDVKPSNQVVVELNDVKLMANLNTLALKKNKIDSISLSKLNKNNLRLVFKLKQPAKSQGFVLPPSQQYGHRLVIDFDFDQQEKEPDYLSHANHSCQTARKSDKQANKQVNKQSKSKKNELYVAEVIKPKPKKQSDSRGSDSKTTSHQKMHKDVAEVLEGLRYWNRNKRYCHHRKY